MGFMAVWIVIEFRPNRKNSDRGIETNTDGVVDESDGLSEPKEFRSRN